MRINLNLRMELRNVLANSQLHLVVYHDEDHHDKDDDNEDSDYDDKEDGDDDEDGGTRPLAQAE